jgi:hypothetical protein
MLHFEHDGSVRVGPLKQLTGPPGDNVIASWGKVRLDHLDDNHGL